MSDTLWISTMIYDIYIIYCIFILKKVNKYDLNNIIVIDYHNLNVLGLVFFLIYMHLEYHWTNVFGFIFYLMYLHLELFLNECNWP